MNPTKIIKKIEIDYILIVALLTGFIFCSYGINWGQVEEWNPDQMALEKFSSLQSILSSPQSFLKPPFHSYFNFFMSYLPLKIIEKLFRFTPGSLSSGAVILIWSRLVIAFLFLSSVALVFQLAKRIFGLFASRIVTLIFATSCGFIATSHFLTVDIPVMFWMLVAFYFIHNIYLRGNISDYTLAGFFTGIATATKYNGLAIGVGIVVAHAFSFKELSWKKSLLSMKLFLGLSMVVIGFLTGNPFALLNYRKFSSDFLYNYITTPIYDESIGHSYWQFFLCLIEIIGLPTFIIISISLVLSLYSTFAKKGENYQVKEILLITSILLLYYITFGSFPRLRTRFVLPIVPLMIILSAPFWNRIKMNKIAISILLISILGYNTICSISVGSRFLEDPRMLAQAWVKANIPTSSSIESTLYTPMWNLVPGVSLKTTRSPGISGRNRLFTQLLKDEFKKYPWLQRNIQELEASRDRNLNWYSLEELMKRQPDYIAINSLYYERFFKTHLDADLYPEMNLFFKNLLSEQYPYQIVFDEKSQNCSRWVYPKEIDFLRNRMVIFQKKFIKDTTFNTLRN